MKNQEELSLKENNELIQQAIDLLKEKHPSVSIHRDDYHIKVWRGVNGVAIDFTRIIQYIPLDKANRTLAYDIVVNLTNNEIIPFNNPSEHGEFYIPSANDLEALAFIKKHFGVFSPSFENTIHEGETEYHISCDNDASFGKCTVNKKTGEQSGVMQGSYIQIQKPPLGDEENIFEMSSTFWRRHHGL